MMSRVRVLDADLHTIEPAEVWTRYLEQRFRARAPAAPAPPVASRPGTQRHPHLAVAAAAGYDARSHLQAMDIEAIEVGVLFGTRGRHVQMYDDIDPEFAAALARAHNDWSYAFCDADRSRLKFAAQIAYHDVDLAVREVERAVHELGAVAVIGNPNPVNGRHVHDPHFAPLWETLARLDVPLCFHPTGVWTLRDDIGRRFLGHAGARMIANAARNPVESMLAFASLVAGGVFDRHPRLRCAFLESGCGWMPWWLARLDQMWETFPGDDDVGIKRRPSEYFRRQCFIAAEPDEKYLPQVIAALGDDNIVFASDYPHFDSLFPHAVSKFLEHDIAPVSREKILWRNGIRLYSKADTEQANDVA